jgi:hypothetical protein
MQIILSYTDAINHTLHARYCFFPLNRTFFVTFFAPPKKTVTDHFRKQQDGFPAIYFIYDISPLMVRAKEWKQSFAHYWTQLCAILGGMYVVAGQAHRVLRILYDRCRFGSTRELGALPLMGR